MDTNKYKATIGLEIHAELATKSKMFCACQNDSEEERPNVNICPVCTAQPGSLPVLNKQAIKNVLKVGIALGSEIADFTEWDRKNYFYPDIPKGYQISQYKYPLVKGGKLNGINITRIHLEEDTASSMHKGEFSLVDFNRAGVPLMELVTEPELHSGKETADFARELQLLLQYLGVGNANMEKGEMRIEANISVSDTDKLGTKVEVKNLNSFKAVERAIDFEIKRQIEVLKIGEKIVQETRGWNEDRQITFSQRLKEDSHDYRYFPDPDLPKMIISEIPEFSKENLSKEIGELPWEKRVRYEKNYGIKETDVEIFVRPGVISDFFEKVCVDFEGDKNLIKLASNYIISDLLGLLKTTVRSESIQIFRSSDILADSIGEESGLKPDHKNLNILGTQVNHLKKFFLGLLSDTDFADLIKMISENKISSRGAKDILKIMFDQGGEPLAIAERENLLQKSDLGELEKIANQIIIDSPKIVADYRAGKEVALMALVGQGMKATKGSANPQVLKEVFLKLLTK
jgi:aspartyl-tRNA(Asn)/glutamyl-tRNA(Gln) amidotransferase subunit B